MKNKFKFRWLTKVPFWTKLHLMDVCYNTDLDAPGYSGIVALISYCRNKYQLDCHISFSNGITTFQFE